MINDEQYIYSDVEEQERMELILYQQHYYGSHLTTSFPDSANKQTVQKKHLKPFIEQTNSPILVSSDSEECQLHFTPYRRRPLLSSSPFGLKTRKDARQHSIRRLLGGCFCCGSTEHNVSLCPKSVCAMCGVAGHRISQCKFRGESSKQCSRCHIRGHIAKKWPELWRQYHNTTSYGPPVRFVCDRKEKQIKFSCALCAGKHHYSKCSRTPQKFYYTILTPLVSYYDSFDIYDNANSSFAKSTISDNKNSSKFTPSKNKYSKSDPSFVSKPGSQKNKTNLTNPVQNFAKSLVKKKKSSLKDIKRNLKSNIVPIPTELIDGSPQLKRKTKSIRLTKTKDKKLRHFEDSSAIKVPETAELCNSIIKKSKMGKFCCVNNNLYPSRKSRKKKRGPSIELILPTKIN